MHIQRGPADNTDAVVAVTLENEAGADQPTSTPLIRRTAFACAGSSTQLALPVP